MNNFNGTDEEIIFNSKSATAPNGGTPVQRKSHSGPDEIVFRRRERKISPEKYNELLEEYGKVVVRDFGDEYHLSEDEKKQKAKFYDAFAKVLRTKKKYRKLDEFVKVFRLYMDCLRVVADDNGVYASEKFMKLVLKGKIKVNGITFPKYIGKDRKSINWKYITDYILDPSMDLSELKQLNTSYEPESHDIPIERCFSPKELREYEYMITHPKEDVDRSYVNEDEAPDGVVFVASDKETKQLTKNIPSVVQCIKEMTKEQRKQNAMSNRMNSFVFEMTADDFEYIAGLDSERGYHSESDIPKFEGDISNRKAYKMYLHRLDEYEYEQVKYNYEGKMRTKSEIDEIELKNDLERAGWNLRNLYRAKDKDKKLRKAYKESKKREDELKKRLIKTQKRNEKRFGKDADIEFNSKKKGKKKKKKDKESD